MNTNWNLKLLLESEDPAYIEKIKSEVKAAWDVFIAKWEKNNEYLTNPKILKEALDEYESINSQYGLNAHLDYYFELKDSLEQGKPEVKAQINKIDEFSTNLANQIQFFEHRISKIDKSNQQVFLDSPELKEYKHYLERAFQDAKYLLTEDQEKVVALLSKPAKYNWTQMVESFVTNDLEDVLTEDGKIEKKTISQIGPMMETRNKAVRDSAYEAVINIRQRWSNIAENEINSILEYKRNSDLLRGYTRPEGSRHLADDIDTEVVDAMVESVKAKYPVINDYFKFKANLLKQDVLKGNEAMVGIEYLDENFDASNIREYSLEECVDLVRNVFKELDPEFEGLYNKFFEEGRVDVYPKQGKTQGAFCASIANNKPVYILLNFTGKMQDCLTLAHEMGHGINDELMRVQNQLNYGTVLSTAEVASTFMEDFVWQKVYQQANDEQKLSLIMQKIEDEIGTIFIQVGCYTFEQELHKQFREKGYLSKEEICEIFVNSLGPVYGKSVEYDSTKFKWVNWTHIRTFFYVYSYASGLLISKSLQNSVKKDPKFIENVKEFLKAGTSKSPKDIFMNLGIDITKKEFWNDGLNEVEELIKQAKDLAIKLNKIK